MATQSRAAARVDELTQGSGPNRYARSRALFERAREVIPGGIHLSGRPLVTPDSSPMYFERGRGCRIWDVDGHEYIDYLLAFGAYALGYAHPAVEWAAFEQAARGRLLSLNHPIHVELIEALLPCFPGTQMGVFFKTGSEATTAALRIARRATGRRGIARAGYHGWHDWCLPLEDFVPAGLEPQVREFNASDPASLEAILLAQPGFFAAVIVAPEMVLPHSPPTFHELQRITGKHGALLIMDEVKTALRIAPNSVSQRVGITPDLICVSKALSSGFPIAAVLGPRDVMRAGSGMHYSATFHGETTAMAAALATLRAIADTGMQAHADKLGRRLIDGLNAIARDCDLPAEAYGEPLPAMPFLRFTHPDRQRNEALSASFYSEVIARGILLHPRHMWFLSAAHTQRDVDQTLDIARAAMRVARAVRPRTAR
jgi:glutamate-1-semialdehyde aminotransferase